MTLGININKNKNPPFGPHFKFFSKTVSYQVNLTLQHSHLEVLLLSRFWSERRIHFFFDTEPQGYKFSCCDGCGLGIFSFIQIAFGHAV